MMDFWNGCGSGAGLYGSLMGLLFLALIIGGIIAFMRLVPRATPGPGSPRSRSAAEDILRERYARGEIDKAEFDERRQHLGD